MKIKELVESEKKNSITYLEQDIITKLSTADVAKIDFDLSEYTPKFISDFVHYLSNKYEDINIYVDEKYTFIVITIKE